MSFLSLHAELQPLQSRLTRIQRLLRLHRVLLLWKTLNLLIMILSVLKLLVRDHFDSLGI